MRTDVAANPALTQLLNSAVESGKLQDNDRVAIEQATGKLSKNEETAIQGAIQELTANGAPDPAQVQKMQDFLAQGTKQRDRAVTLNAVGRWAMAGAGTASYIAFVAPQLTAVTAGLLGIAVGIININQAMRGPAKMEAKYGVKN